MDRGIDRNSSRSSSSQQLPKAGDVIRQDEVEELLQVYLEYCSYGSSYYCEDLSDSRFIRFCRDMGILGPTRASRGLLPQLDVDLVFVQSKPVKNAKKITFEGFCKALYLLSDKLGIGFSDLMHQAIEMGGPRPTERAARNYLSSEAPVFAMDSRLRGHSPPKNPHTKILTLKEMVRPDFVPKPARKLKPPPPPEPEPPMRVTTRSQRAPGRHHDLHRQETEEIDMLAETARRAKARSGLSSWQLGQNQPQLPERSSYIEAAIQQHEMHRQQHETHRQQHESHRQPHQQRIGRYRDEGDENDYEGVYQSGGRTYSQSGRAMDYKSAGCKTPEQRTIGRFKDPSSLTLTPPMGPSRNTSSAGPKHDSASNVYMRLLGSSFK